MDEQARVLLRVGAVARMIGTTESRAYELVRLGVLPGVRLGRQLRFDPDQIEEFIAAGGKGLPGGWRRQPQ